jgi:hypothetical protein
LILLPDSLNRLLQDYAARIEKVTKRVDRLETLEFSSAAFPSGGLVCIETVKLAAPAASVTLPTAPTTIPATWWHLWLWISAKEEPDGHGSAAFLRFNGDSAANYLSYYNLWSRNQGNVDTMVSVGGTSNATEIQLMTVAGGWSAGENDHRNGCEVNIYDYAATDMNKTVTWKGWSHNPPDPEGTVELVYKALGGGIWQSLSAITSLTVHAAAGASFDTGSVFTLMAICQRPSE